MNSQKMNVSKSENILIHLLRVFTHFITKSNKNINFKVLVAPQKKTIPMILTIIVVYLTSLCVNWAFFGTRAKKGPIYTRTS
jgi:hypothetical protein